MVVTETFANYAAASCSNAKSKVATFAFSPSETMAWDSWLLYLTTFLNFVLMH